MDLALSPVGSFRTAANPAFEAEARHELGEVVAAVRDAIKDLPVRGLLLTGSFARGEGTIVAAGKRGSRWLSDIESLVLFAGDRKATRDEVERTLARLVESRNLDADHYRRKVKLELSATSLRTLRRMRPSLFSYELAAHGKLLFGVPSSIPAFGPDSSGFIPKRDAFRLLNNRIVEQLSARLALSDRVADQATSVRYSITKFWLDLATSLSIFLGQYRPTYKERCELFCVEPQCSELDLPVALRSRLKIEVRGAFAAKFGHGEVVTDDLAGAVEAAATTAAEVWQWESNEILGPGPDDNNERSILVRLRRLETARQRARDWMRLLTQRERRPYLKRATLRSALQYGSLANVIYGAGCLLHFYWNEVEARTPQGIRIATRIAGLLGADSTQPQTLARAVTKAWETHLRFAPL